MKISRFTDSQIMRILKQAESNNLLGESNVALKLNVGNIARNDLSNQALGVPIHLNKLSLTLQALSAAFHTTELGNSDFYIDPSSLTDVDYDPAAGKWYEKKQDELGDKAQLPPEQQQKLNKLKADWEEFIRNQNTNGGDANNNGIPDIHESIDPRTKTAADAAKAALPPRRDPLTFDLNGDGLSAVGVSTTNPIDRKSVVQGKSVF